MMRLPPFRYFAPGTVREAIDLLTEHGPTATVVAGGTIPIDLTLWFNTAPYS